MRNKTIVLNNEATVSVTGAATLTDKARDGTVLWAFNATDILTRIKQTLPPHASVTAIANIVVDKVNAAMKSMPPQGMDWLIQHQNALGGEVFEWFLVGYENGVPLVRDITVKIDRNTGKIAGPFIHPVYPRPDKPFDPDSHVIVCAISHAAYNFFFSPASEERRAAGDILTKGMETLDGGTIPDSKVAAGMAADLIRLEVKFDPEFVGPPINVVVLSNQREPEIISLPK